MIRVRMVAKLSPQRITPASDLNIRSSSKGTTPNTVVKTPSETGLTRLIAASMTADFRALPSDVWRSVSSISTMAFLTNMPVNDREQPHLSGPIQKLLHDWPLVHRGDGFRRCWAAAQSTMWSFSVVVGPQNFDDLGFTERVADLTVQQCIHCPAGHVYMPERGASGR